MPALEQTAWVQIDSVTEKVSGGIPVDTVVPNVKNITWWAISGRELDAFPDSRRVRRNIGFIIYDEVKIKDIIRKLDGDDFEIQSISRFGDFFEGDALAC